MPICLGAALIGGAYAAVGGYGAYKSAQYLASPQGAHDVHRAAAVSEAVASRVAHEIRHGFNDIPAGAISRHAQNIAAQPHLGHGSTQDEHLVELWNEKPGRTHEQVLSVLDSAIARQRARMSGQR